MDQAYRSISEDDLKQDLAGKLDQVKESREPLVVTREGRGAIVMIDIHAYEELQRRQELLHLLAKGQRDMDAGRGHDLDEVFAEADEILNSGQ